MFWNIVAACGRHLSNVDATDLRSQIFNQTVSIFFFVEIKIHRNLPTQNSEFHASTAIIYLILNKIYCTIVRITFVIIINISFRIPFWFIPFAIVIYIRAISHSSLPNIVDIYTWRSDIECPVQHTQTTHIIRISQEVHKSTKCESKNRAKEQNKCESDRV